jgi:hypothetical protein
MLLFKSHNYEKALLLLTVLCGLSISSFAQSSKEGGKFSIGVEAGLPLGDVKDATNFVIGGSLKYDHPIAEGIINSLQKTKPRMPAINFMLYL